MLQSILVGIEIKKAAGDLVWKFPGAILIFNVFRESIFSTMIGFEYLQYWVIKHA